MAKSKSGLKPGLESVVLDHDHWHGGEFYPAGAEIPNITPKRKKYFSRRGWIVDPKAGAKATKGKGGESKPE